MANFPPEAVLVVDDDPDTRDNLRDILELDNFQVEMAGSAAEVLARRDWSQIGVVVLDRKLPDGTAQDLLPHIKRAAPLASVVVVTGFADVESAVAALKMGAEDYILKPINSHELRARLGHIREHKRTRLALEKTEQWFREMAENIDQVFWVCDDELREMLYVSPAFAKVWGFECEKLITRPRLWLESIHPDDKARMEEAFFRIAGRGYYDEEYRIIRPDGGVRWIHGRRSFLRGNSSGGRLLGGIATDITDRKESTARALQAERLAAIGETMAGLAHESRNALQRSKACLEMLVLEVEDRPEALDLVARTMRAQEHLQQLYEEVRQYAAPIVLKRERVDVCQLWREIWADVTHTHSGKQLRIEEDCDGAPTEMEIDRFAIGRVFRNILENALDAAPHESKLTIRLNQAAIGRTPAVAISFRDEGPGIPSEQRAKIFEPFFTTKTKGTGLGMAIARRIVESHGGQIAVGAPDNGGAEIVVTLPRADQ